MMTHFHNETLVEQHCEPNDGGIIPLEAFASVFPDLSANLHWLYRLLTYNNNVCELVDRFLSKIVKCIIQVTV